MKLKRLINYLWIFALCAILWIGVYWKYTQDLDIAQYKFRSEEHDKTIQVAQQIERVFDRIYGGLITISRLPAIKEMDKYDTTLSNNERRTVNEIYKNIVNDVLLSNIYIVPKTFTPNKVNEKPLSFEKYTIKFDNQKLTSPLLDLEELNLLKNEQPPYNSEYRIMRNQLNWMQISVQNEDLFKELLYPAITSKEVLTYDTSYPTLSQSSTETAGTVMSVPFYDNQRLLKGCISGIVASSFLKETLKPPSIALISQNYQYTIMHDDFQKFATSLNLINKGSSDPSLIYSEVIPININDFNNKWLLWAASSNEDYWNRIDVITAKQNFLISQIGIIIILISLGIGFYYIKHALKNAQLNEIAKAQALAQNEFIAQISHEIRNPLAIIKSSASVLGQQFDENSKENELIHYMEEEVDRVDSLLMQLFRLQDNPDKLLTKENIAAIIENVILLFHGEQNKRGVKIHFNNHCADLTCPIYKDQIKQLIINLALNALEASKKGSVINISTEANTKTYDIIFEDFGIGIEKSKSNIIFKHFYTTKQNGLGLGLSVVKKIIDAHHAKINLESRLGEGTKITVQLPRRGGSHE